MLRRLLHRLSIDLVRTLDQDDLRRRRLQLITAHGIDLLFDVGAHTGQYGQAMRALGYGGRLVSFEPLPGPFSELQKNARHDADWEAINVALGDHEGRAEMHVSKNTQSSSVLEMLPAHSHAAPSSAYVDVCQVPMTTLSQMIDAHMAPDERLFVKVDAQGYEDQILGGAGDAIRRVTGLQLELSLIPLYEGQRRLDEMLPDIARSGFVLMSLEPGFWDHKSGQLLQADGIFFRP